MSGAILPFAARTWEDEPIKAVPLPSMQRYRPIARIQATVAVSYGVDPKSMRTSDRSRDVSWPRQVAMYLSREISGKSLPCIGQLFGHRDHTTVTHAIKAVEKRMAADPVYRADVEVLRKALR